MSRVGDLDIELAKLYIYAQEVSVKKGDDSKKELNAYIQTALNSLYVDNNDRRYTPFYKVRLQRYTESQNENILRYVINFHLISMEHWDETLVPQKLNEILPKCVKVVSSRLVEYLKSVKRNPTSTDELWADDNPGCSNIPGDNCCEQFCNYWLVVPRVQWDFFDLLYQMYTFDIFHQGFVAKFVHFFTIPTNVMLSMMFLAQFNIPTVGELRYGQAFAVNFALLLFGLLAIAYIIMGILRKSWAWGFATVVVIAVLNMAGNLWYYGFRVQGSPWYNPTTWPTNPLIWSYAISFLQASSHMTEPQIPPNISGVNHWESLHVFFMAKRKTTTATIKQVFFVFCSLLLFPVLSVSVAWFSWPHLIGTEVIYVMAGIGYRPSFFERYFRIVEKAELQGNPILDKFPMTPDDIRLNVPKQHLKTLEDNDLVPRDASDKEILSTIATLKLTSMYMRRGVKQSKVKETKGDQCKNLDVMLAARKGNIVRRRLK